MDLKHIKGIGDKTIETLYDSNIYSVEELVSYFPYRYQVLQPEILEDAKEKVGITINARVCGPSKVSYIRKNFNSLRFLCDTYGKQIQVVIFNRAFLKPKLTIGQDVTLIGKYDAKKNTFTANDIKFTKLEQTRILPIYHFIKGLKNSTLEKLILNALHEIKNFEQILPFEVEKKYSFLSKFIIRVI